MYQNCSWKIPTGILLLLCRYIEYPVFSVFADTHSIKLPHNHKLSTSVSKLMAIVCLPVCLFFIIWLFLFRFVFYLVALFFICLNWTASVIRQWWIVGCRPPAAHQSPWPHGPQAGPRTLCTHRGSCGLPAGWGGGPLWSLTFTSSFVLFHLCVTSVGGGPSAFSANQLETGERCRLLWVHPLVCRMDSTSFFPFHYFEGKRQNCCNVQMICWQKNLNFRSFHKGFLLYFCAVSFSIRMNDFCYC